MNNAHRRGQLTLPGMSFKERQYAYVRIESKITESEKVDDQEDGRHKAQTCRVTDLQTGKMYQLICPKIMVTTFEDLDDDYVGKCFEIYVSKTLVAGKRYKQVEVYEIDPNVDYSNYPTTEEDYADAEAEALKKAD